MGKKSTILNVVLLSPLLLHFLPVCCLTLQTREILSELVLLGKGSISTEFTENSKKTVVAIGFKEDNVPEYAIKKDEGGLVLSYFLIL